MVNESAVTSMVVDGEEEDCAATVSYWPDGNTDGGDGIVEMGNFFSTYHVCQVARHAEKRTHDCCRRMLSVTPVDVMQVRLGKNDCLNVHTPTSDPRI